MSRLGNDEPRPGLQGQRVDRDLESEVQQVLGQLTQIEKASLLFGESVWDSRSLPRLGLRSAVMSDGPHGVRRQLGSGDHLGIAGSEPATCFPTAAAVACSWDTGLAEQIGMGLGAEAAALGVDVLLGPGLNTKRNPLGGRSFEYFSEDPLLAGRMAAGYVRGIQSLGVAACPKHFAVNSQERRRMASDSVVDERTLRELYLTGFEIVVRESAPRVLMTSYNKVNGTYANENAHLLREILRGEWDFDGTVVTDWGGGNDEVSAVRTGGGFEMPAPGLAGARRLVAAVESGELSQADLDARAAEVLRLLLSLSDGQPPAPDPEAQHRLARRAAERSAVLLRNEGAILPLAAGTRVAVIGDMAREPRYQGAGSSLVNPTRLESILDAIGAYELEVVGRAQGYTRQGAPDESLIAKALKAASGADVVLLFLGLDELSETEGADRSHLRLPDNQVELLNTLADAGARIVVVLAAGSVVEMPWIERTEAVLHMHLAGQAGATATLNLLTGAANPSGKLAETHPMRLEDLASSTRFPATGPVADYREGLFVGYRQLDTQDAPVRFPFGYGLSYSTFEYSGLEVSPGGVRLDVTNTSTVDGDEVVQLYVSRLSQGAHRPAQELKGFARVHVPAGGTVPVEIPFDRYTFRFFDTATAQWQIEEGEYELRVGASSRDIRLTSRLHQDGTVPPRIDERVPARYRVADVADVPDEDFASLLRRAVPTGTETGEITAQSPLSDLGRARSRTARVVHRVLERRLSRSERTGHPDLNLLFVLNMPLRAMGKMTGGLVDAEMVDGVVDIVNGHGLRGTRRVVSGFLANRRADRTTLREISGGVTRA